MRHSVFGRQLSRDKNERRRLLQGLARDLIHHGIVRTTLAKAKAVQPLIEKLVTSAKKSFRGGSRRGASPQQQVRKVLSDKVTEQLLMADAGTRFAARQSGFTRIVKLGPRMGDNAEEVMLQFVDERVIVEVVKPAEKNVKKVVAVKESVSKQKKSAPIKRSAGKRGRPKKTK
ncbi:MAG: 50S ribosomal protein L17 [Candidatus Gottesmanbacteria bacterium]|nr:50S ribosomal protein L17 [Candidatus Gottesmanbacteria bacterium]